MAELNPNNKEGQQPLSPEEIEALRRRQEAQEKANQMLTAMERETQEPGVRFEAEPSSKHADAVKQIVNPEGKEKQPEVHHEAGIPLKTKYTSDKEMIEAMQKLIHVGGVPYDLHVKMEDAMEQFNDKAA